jgi:hypothetical protein
MQMLVFRVGWMMNTGWLAAMLIQVTLLQSQLAAQSREQHQGLACSYPSLDATDAPTKSNNNAPMNLRGSGRHPDKVMGYDGSDRSCNPDSFCGEDSNMMETFDMDKMNDEVQISL